MTPSLYLKHPLPHISETRVIGMPKFISQILIVLMLTMISSSLKAQDTNEAIVHAISLFEEGDYAQFALILNEQSDLISANSTVHYYQGLANIVTGNLRDSIESISLAVDSEPENAEYLYALAMAYEFRGQEVNPIRGVSMARSAKRLLIEALDIDPNHLPSLRALAIRLLSFPSILGGDVSEGLPLLPLISTLDEAAELEVRASYERRHGSTEAAEEYYLQAIAADESTIHIRVALGKMYFDQELYREAAEVLEPISYSTQPDRWDLPVGLRKNRGHIFAAASYFYLGDREGFERHVELARETSLFEDDLAAIGYWFDRYDIDETRCCPNQTQ